MEFTGDYVVVRSITEASGTARTLRAIIEARLTAVAGSTITLPAALATSITVRNNSANDAKLAHTSTTTTDYIVLAAGVTRQLVNGARLSLDSVFYNVGVTNDPVEIEVTFE